MYPPSGGTAALFGRPLLELRAAELAGAGVARTFQNLALFPRLTVLENVLVGRHHLMRSGALAGGLRIGRVRREERAHRAAAQAALELVALDRQAGATVATLPYGVQKRVELARAVAMEPRLLMLDEPVAGLDETERAEMTATVRRLHAERALTVLLVEHDMGMVMRTADRVLVLDHGEVIALGTPAAVQRDERVIRAYLGEDVGAAA